MSNYRFVLFFQEITKEVPSFRRLSWPSNCSIYPWRSSLPESDSVSVRLHPSLFLHCSLFALSTADVRWWTGSLSGPPNCQQCWVRTILRTRRLQSSRSSHGKRWISNDGVPRIGCSSPMGQHCPVNSYNLNSEISYIFEVGFKFFFNFFISRIFAFMVFQNSYLFFKFLAKFSLFKTKVDVQPTQDKWNSVELLRHPNRLNLSN